MHAIGMMFWEKAKKWQNSQNYTLFHLLSKIVIRNFNSDMPSCGCHRQDPVTLLAIIMKIYVKTEPAWLKNVWEKVIKVKKNMHTLCIIYAKLSKPQTLSCLAVNYRNKGVSI